MERSRLQCTIYNAQFTIKRINTIGVGTTAPCYTMGARALIARFSNSPIIDYLHA